MFNTESRSLFVALFNAGGAVSNKFDFVFEILEACSVDQIGRLFAKIELDNFNLIADPTHKVVHLTVRRFCFESIETRGTSKVTLLDDSKSCEYYERAIDSRRIN